MKNINILTKEELVRTKNHCLTVGDLRRILEDKTISDDTIVLVERITDYYFENNTQKLKTVPQAVPKDPDAHAK